MRPNHIILLGSSLHKKYVKLSEEELSLDAIKTRKEKRVIIDNKFVIRIMTPTIVPKRAGKTSLI